MTKITDPPSDEQPEKTVLDVTRLSPTPSTPPVHSPTATTGWLSSSGAIDHGRFAPGTILGGRYRVIGRLGRGGMGDVYRADDLKLGQPVALKFLPSEVDRDPARLTQLHTEVRMARQVSHPNVCRVYDIDEVEGHTFLSMEYVDGEDLASLLRRITRFPEERGLEIARQICAGLAAAHERNVVHRDFKPANVMLDSTGRVRITDFGLAGISGEAIRAGTPAYMAPEQLAGGEVTGRSDIYALGLVLYEIFTGKRALEGSNLAEMINRREQGDITPPSQVTRDLSPEIDRAIMRCLVADPAARPASALAVSAALPGGDPLAAALAAGETPSPEMVAAAGKEGALARLPGVSLLAFVIIGLIVAAFICDRVLFVGRAPEPKSADVLEERGRTILARAGHTAAVADDARGISTSTEYTGWVRGQNASANAWDALTSGNAPVLRFWYRTSPRPLLPSPGAWQPGIADPPLSVPGMATVVLDDRGRLLEMVFVPGQRETATPATTPVDWAAFFTDAELPMAQFSAVTPEWAPRVFGDERVAWEGPMRGHPDAKVRVEAASYRGRPVSFQVVWPWTRPVRTETVRVSASQRAFGVAGYLLILAMLGGAVAIARFNLKSGRADRRGASRIALFLIGVWILSWALAGRHWYALQEEFNFFFGSLAFMLLNVGFTWLFYLGLEPFVRKLRPEILISWTRLLGGQLRDPRVGRDVLIGVALGVLMSLVGHLDSLLLPWVTGESQQPQVSPVQYLLGLRFSLGALVRTLPNSLQSAMLATFAYVMLLTILRRGWIANLVIILLITAVVVAEDGIGGRVWLVVVIALCFAVPLIFVFLRFGLLSLATGLMTLQALGTAPLTADLSKPHGTLSAIAILILISIASYAFHVSKAGAGLARKFIPAV